jgi:hypothetical protein
MTRRRVLCGLLFLSAVLACFGGWLWMANRPRPMRAKFEQVKKGMSRAEVIRTVGWPPGDYSREGVVQMHSEVRFWVYDRWFCDDGELLVRFDDADTASDVVIQDVVYFGPPKLTLTERIRRWLGL